MASYEKRGKKWRVVVSVMDKGVRRKVSKTFNTKREATEWSVQMESDKFQNKKIIASSMLFSDYFKMWVKNYKSKDIRASTLTAYITAENIIDTLFTNVRLEDLNYPILQHGLDEYGESHKKSYLTLLVAKIKASLKDALYDGYITSDFFSRLKPHGLESDVKIKALSADEFEILQAYLYAHSNDKINLSLLVALETGMRIGEVLALNYEDVSAPFNNIHVDKSLTAASREITPPKNKNSYRDVRITKELTAVIFNSGSSGRIFGHTHQAALKRIQRVTKSLNIYSKLSVHGLRHSHASYLLYKGVSINYISKRLGHANTSITQEVYAHMLKEERISETDKALDVLSMSPNVPKNAINIDIAKGN